MNIYSYNSSTGEFVTQSQADESPLEPGVFLMPANATDIAPPSVAARQTVVFVSGQWEVKPDYRGVALFSTVDGSQVSITEIGETPTEVGATELPRPSQAHAWLNGAWVADPLLQAELEAREQSATIKRYEAALDAHLDGVAQAHRYTDRFTFALRAGYAGPYQAEGLAYAQWMDTCNVQAYALLQRVLAGQEALPPLQTFIDGLPAFALPGGQA
jgi:hypothetical protein